MKTNITSEDWSGEVLELHAKPKLSAVMKEPVKKTLKQESLDFVGVVESKPDILVHRGIRKKIRVKYASDTPTTADEQTLTAASPIPADTNPVLVAQVEAARKVLGISNSTINPAPNSPFPPTFDNSVDMKEAFTRALKSPMPQKQMPERGMTMTIDLPDLDIAKAPSSSSSHDHEEAQDLLGKTPKPRFVKINHSNDQVKKQHTKPDDSNDIEPILVTASAVVINPTGATTMEPDYHRSRTITKFAPKALLSSAGWSATVDEAARVDAPTDTAPTSSHKPFTIDEVTEPKS